MIYRYLFFHNSDGIPDGENVYPAVDETVTRTAYEANYDGNCKHAEHTIQIKGCDGYFVYHLKPVTGCFAAYCFGKIYKVIYFTNLLMI